MTSGGTELLTGRFCNLLDVIREHRQQGSVALVASAAALLGLLALLWIIGTVPSGGPDEPAHMIRSAALVRGQLDGQPHDEIGRAFDVPAWVGYPDRHCFSLVGKQPATCATEQPRPVGNASLVSSANHYPIWGHLLPGLATYMPASIGYPFARAFDAAIPVGLFVAGLTLAARHGRLALGSAALAITPMAWFSVIVVNPSGLVIAGGFALWAALLSANRLMRGQPDRLVAWSIAAGWAAASLPRRDGVIWAALIVAICAASGIINLRRVAQRLGAGPAALVIVSTLATVVWAATSDTASSRVMILAPFLPVVGAAVHRLWTRCSTIGQRLAIAAAIVGGLLAALVVVSVTRRHGYDEALLERVISQTGINFEEAVGLLGWLDTPLPRAVLYGWWVTFGVLLGVAVIRGRRRSVAMAAATVGIAVAVSWILEMSQASTTGSYWQGRYYLPLLMGVPMALAWPSSRGGESVGAAIEHRIRTIGSAVLAIALTVLTIAFGASMRRWAVGTHGSHRPWLWDTYGAALPPWILLVVHAAACVALYVLASGYVLAVRSRPSSERSPADCTDAG